MIAGAQDVGAARHAQRERGADATWRVLHTRPRQEKALAQQLAQMHIWHLLPLARVVRFYGSRRAVVHEPLFPGYVFMRGERDQAFQADRTGRVVSIIDVGDAEQLERELEQIQAVLQGGGTLTRCPPLEAGTEVEITSGPFRGVKGVVGHARPGDRLVLHVHMIGSAAELEVDRSLLRRID